MVRCDPPEREGVNTMSEPVLTCTESTCAATGENPLLRAQAAGATKGLTIDIVSDVICPWCFIGKRRLERALDLLGHPQGVQVTWRPFQLNPQMPPQGIERRAYRTAKFGTWERSLALDAQVAAAGAEEGLSFAFDKMVRTPNTLDAHRLIWLAEQRGVQDGVAERLFKGYFEEGVDLSDPDQLARLAVEGGIPSPEVEALLAGNVGRAEVLEEEAKYKAQGVSGVPAFFLNGVPAFSGAVPPPMLAEAIQRVLSPA